MAPHRKICYGGGLSSSRVDGSKRNVCRPGARWTGTSSASRTSLSAVSRMTASRRCGALHIPEAMLCFVCDAPKRFALTLWRLAQTTPCTAQHPKAQCTQLHRGELSAQKAAVILGLFRVTATSDDSSVLGGKPQQHRALTITRRPGQAP